MEQRATRKWSPQKKTANIYRQRRKSAQISIKEHKTSRRTDKKKTRQEENKSVESHKIVRREKKSEKNLVRFFFVRWNGNQRHLQYRDLKKEQTKNVELSSEFPELATIKLYAIILIYQ